VVTLLLGPEISISSLTHRAYCSIVTGTGFRRGRGKGRDRGTGWWTDGLVLTMGLVGRSGNTMMADR
jgi:hypothetical protein